MREASSPGLTRADELVEQPGLGRRRGPPLVQDLLQRQDAGRGFVGEGDVVPDLGQPGPNGLDLLPMVGVRDDDDRGVRVVDDVADLFRDERRVDRHGQPAGAERREVGHGPFGPVLGKKAELLARFEAEGPEPEREVLDARHRTPRWRWACRPHPS